MNSEKEIQELREKYARLEGIVDERLHKCVMNDNNLIHIMHRVKTVDSIRGKLVRKADHYPSIYEITDILGFRVITYFSSDVDIVAKKIAEQFRVDWSKSKDKRKIIDARSFGYVSLHYICSLPESEGELSNLWFEIQIKSILQHCWAEIEHDLGYKTEIEIPREIRRSFSRAASLLETTDEIFVDIRHQLDEYTSRVKKDIANEQFDDITFDAITLSEFTAHNSTYLKLLHEIAAITDAHIVEGATDNQLVMIDFLGIHTLGEMIVLINEVHDLALSLAKKTLENSELDELSSTVAFHYIFRAKLISGGYSRERIQEFFRLTMKNEKKIESDTEKILKEREKIRRDG